MGIKKVWYRVADAADIAPGAGLKVKVGTDDDCAVFRTVSGEFYAAGILCPHQNELLDRGRLEECEVICRRHHLRFDLRSGNCTNACGYSLRTFELREEFGEIFVARWEDE